jgi:Zn-dependent peptidase ImmA (M78 family)
VVRPRKPAKRYPPIPTQVDAPSGIIQIEMRDDLDGKDAKPDDPDTMGQYDPLNRTIALRRKMPRRQQWHTLFHEYVHLWLNESGISNGLNGEFEEAVCDAISTGMMRERFG